MELSKKEKILLGAIGTVLVLCIASACWAVFGRQDTKPSPRSTAAETSKQKKRQAQSKSTDKNKTDLDPSMSESSETRVESVSTPTPAASDTASTRTHNPQVIQHQDSAPSSHTREQYVEPKDCSLTNAQKQNATSAEKARHSQALADNARWANNEMSKLSARGLSHSGMAQEITNTSNQKLQEEQSRHANNLSNIELAYACS